MVQFSVIIVNFNGGSFLAGALESLKRQTRRDFEVILIDNGSTDGSLDLVDPSGLPAFRMEPLDKNVGFARANNIAADLARGRWLVFLNPDAEAAPDWLDRIAAGAARHPDVRVFSSAQYALDDPGQLDGVGDAYLAFGIPWRGGFGRPASEMPDEGECFTACGAAAVYLRALFLAYGGFDERFFCYCEDVDLGFRLQLAGERCIFLPDAVVHHAGSGVAGRTSDFTLYHGYRNRIWVYAKNMPAPMAAVTLPGHVVLLSYLLVRAAMTGRFRISWRGVVDGLRGIPEMRRRSRWSSPPRQIRLVELARAMAWNPLRLRGHRTHVRPLRPGPA